MKTTFSVLALGLCSSLAASAAGLKAIDLSKDFSNAAVNVLEDSRYKEGAVILVPPPTSKDDSYMVSIEEEGKSNCWITGVSVRRVDDATYYYTTVRISELEPEAGRCTVGVHIKNKQGIRKAFVRFVNAQ
jgi:hypothetical protein